MIKISNFKKSFGSQEVLKGIDIILPEGSIIGLVGANGAGKTTLFRSVAGLESYEGQVAIESKSQPLAFLSSNPEYLSFMTGKEYLTFMCKARKMEEFDCEASNIFELPLSKYASKYSTGMKKKLALTALLMQKNNFFILDEPFSGVDFESNLIINQVIQKLKEAGKAILISSHILSSLTDICDEIHFLKEGLISNSIPKGDFKTISESIEFENIEAKLSKLKF